MDPLVQDTIFDFKALVVLHAQIRRQLRVGSEEEAEIKSVPFAEVNGLLGTARDLASRGLLVSVRSFRHHGAYEAKSCFDLVSQPYSTYCC